MNNRIALGVVGALILAALFFAYTNFGNKETDIATLSDEGTTTPTTVEKDTTIGTAYPSPSQPSTSSTKPEITVVTGKIALFNVLNMKATTSSPIITGIANVPMVDVIIVDSTGRGLAAGRDIKVVGGRWDYSPPLLLQPGTYTVQLLGGEQPTQTTLTVTY